MLDRQVLSRRKYPVGPVAADEPSRIASAVADCRNREAAYLESPPENADLSTSDGKAAFARVDHEVMSPALDRRPPFGAVLRLVSREDPEGLLASGAPSDEYANEAAELAGLLRGGRAVTGEVLVKVWERWFGPGSGYVRRTPKTQVDKLAAELDALH